MEMLRHLSFILLLMALTSCGGGSLDGSSGDGSGDGGSGDGNDETVITVALAISDTNVTELLPATLTVTVLNDGQAVSGEVVTFTSTLGSFFPEVGTALTASDGSASIILRSGDIAGAGVVVAAIASGEQASIGFTTQAVSQTVWRIGSGTPFVEGEIAVSVPSLSAGGTSVLSVSVSDQQGSLYQESMEVNFTSSCSESAIATATIDSPVLSANGSAQSTYLAQGCVGDDTITANVVVGEQNLTATGVVTVQAAQVGSIQFVSATPEHIAIKGAGSEARPESATVVFKVLDSNGLPVSNTDVSFALSSMIGGITFSPAQGTTNLQGLVQTVVNSGTVPRPLRVTASIDNTDPEIATQSSELKISTGIPDQDSISLSVDNKAPNAWNYDGSEVTVTARLADAFNNPPPPTTVYFTTEGGSIETLGSSCLTDDNGACSVTWRSQYPRPEGHIIGDENNPDQVPEVDNTMGQKYGGRVTILATTIGEESFPDLNGNGRFDECEMAAFIGGIGKPCNADGSINTSGADITYTGLDVSGQPYDLPEAYIDHNEDGFYNPGQEDPSEQDGGQLEELTDFNENGIYDAKDGKYNGVLCSLPAHDGCSSQTAIDVRAQAVIIMSGNNPHVCIRSSNDGLALEADEYVRLADIDNRVFCQVDGQADVDGEYQNPNADTRLVLPVNSQGSFSLVISDLHNQPLPSGTTVKFDTSIGKIIVGDEELTWAGDNHNGGLVVSGMLDSGAKVGGGIVSMIIEIPEPHAEEITISVFNVTVR